MPEKAIVTFWMHQRDRQVDLELDLDMTAHDLVLALNQVYALALDAEDINQCYMASENPIALLRGGRTLKEFGIHTGSMIHFTR